MKPRWSRLSPLKKRIRARYMLKYALLAQDPLGPEAPAEDASEEEAGSEDLLDKALDQVTSNRYFGVFEPHEDHEDPEDGDPTIKPV